MGKNAGMIYEFSGFHLDPATRTLLRKGVQVGLTAKVFDTLMFLVQNPGRVLEKDELLGAIWPGSFVEEGNLSQNMFILRKVLGDDRNGNSLIKTIPRRGYQFVAPVKVTDASEMENGSSGGSESSGLSEYWRTHSPFRSLQVFEPEDAWLFFGRDAEIEELVARLDRSPVLVIVGNSGCGKSSLIRAGLIAALRAGQFHHQDLEGEQWRIAMFRPSASPFDYLAETLPHQLAPELGLKDQAELIADCRSKLPSGGEALRNAISTLAHATAGKTEPTRVLLVVDQFEEIFTLTGSQEIRNRYIDGLLAAARLDSAVPVHLVLALRADFYAHCLEHAGLRRCLETNLYNVPPMSAEQLRETIERRLQLARGQAESGLMNSLLEDVGAEPGNLALLEHALGQLWEKCADSGKLTNRAYGEIGRLRGALGRHADAVYEGLSEKQKELAQKIFLELVHLGEGAQDTRRRVPKRDLLCLAIEEEVELLLARLASSRLISTSRDGEETFIEVSHEALIREWPTLREWLTQNREELGLERRLLQAAQEWEALRRDPGALLQGARLVQAEDWVTRHPEASPILREYLQTSIEAHAEAARKEHEAQARELARQKAAAKRFRLFSYVVTALLLLAVGLAWFAYHQQVLEKSRKLAAQSEELLPRDHGRALDLALEGWSTAKTEEARLAVTKAFPEQLFILRHEGAVNSVTFSPDGQRILSASQDHTARIWNAADGQLLATLNGHSADVWYADFSPDGRRIVTVSFDYTARVWNTADGRLLATLKGHTEKLEHAAFSPDGTRIVTSSFDHTAMVWNATDGRLLATLKGHTDQVIMAEFSPDGKQIVTAGGDHTARVWDSADGRLLITLQHDAFGVSYANFSPDNRGVVTASNDQKVRVWNKADGRLLRTLQHNGPVSWVVFSPTANHMLTTSIDHTARVWNSADGRLLLTLQHEGPVQAADFSRDGQLIVTVSDRIVKVWSATDGRLLATLEGNADRVNQASFSPSGDRVVTSSADHTVRIWNIALSGRPIVLSGHTNYVYNAEFSPDGQRIVTSSLDHTARIWRTADGRLLATLQGHTDVVSQATFSPDGQRIATASYDHTARLWRSTDGRLLATLQGHTDLVVGVQFSPDGQRIVTAGRDGTACVWSSADGRLLATLQGHTSNVTQANFSPDGQRIITGSLDQTARIWNTTDGRLLATLQGHTAIVFGAQFSPDGQRIVTASGDHTARIWNSADYRLLATLEHPDKIFGAQFSPDGQRIVTASRDHTARIWSSADGRLLATLQGHTDLIYPAHFSPDGQRIVTASADQTARIWSTADSRLLATLQGHTFNVYQARFSPDGQRILTGSFDQTARVWQLLTLDDIGRILAK